MDIVVEYRDTGALEIYVDKVVKKWNHLWWIAQWKDSYRLIKYKRKDSPITTIKFTISKKQAHELIGQLDLKSEPGGIGSATSWRQSSS